MAVRVAIPLAVAELHRARARMMLVSERDMAHAVRDYAEVGIRVEGSGAASLAGFRNLTQDDESAVLIVTGRNIDDELHRRCVEHPDSFPD
jgi:threonine dehydratase